MKLFTYTLSSGSIAIAEADGVTQISIQANSGSSCNITGDISFKGLAPTAISLAAGESLTLTAPFNSPISGLTIAQTSGTIDIIVGL